MISPPGGLPAGGGGGAAAGALLRMREPMRMARAGGLGTLRRVGIGYPPRVLGIPAEIHVADLAGTRDRYQPDPVGGPRGDEQATAAERPDDPRPDGRADAGPADLAGHPGRGGAGMRVGGNALGGDV